MNNNNGHEYVDFGLPSGTLWATCNVGAKNPEDYGDYFAWGEIRPKEFYKWNTYKFAQYQDTLRFTKYVDESGYGVKGYMDRLKNLQTIDDAATVNWGGQLVYAYKRTLGRTFAKYELSCLENKK